MKLMLLQSNLKMACQAFHKQKQPSLVVLEYGLQVKPVREIMI